MMPMNKWATFVAFCITLSLPGLSSCTTNDVEDPQGNGERTLYEIKDRALGEYLVYNCSRTDENKLPYGTVIVENGKHYLDTDKAATADNLYLVKNESQVAVLERAGLVTAAVKIVDMDGLQFFTALKTLKITSNEVVNMDVTALTQLETVEMNNNFVAALDLSHNTKLVRFRYGGSATAPASTKLSVISFAKNTLIEHIYLKSQNIQVDGFTLPESYSKLTELDLSSNPGAPFAIPEALMAQLTTAAGVVAIPSEGGGEEELYPITDKAFAEYLYYQSVTSRELPEGLVVKEGEIYRLDKAIAATVSILNVSKTSAAIDALTAAQVETAKVLIASADGLQFFTALKEFTATSNQFTQPLPLRTLVQLEKLQVNTAGISSLDLSANVKLTLLNCNGSSKSGYGKLTTIDLSHTPDLETLNLKSNSLQTISVSNLTKLKVLELSGNPGADFTIPAVIYGGLTTKSGVKSE